MYEWLDAGPSELPESLAIALKPRSLLVFKDEAYTNYLHGIDEVSALANGQASLAVCVSTARAQMHHPSSLSCAHVSRSFQVGRFPASLEHAWKRRHDP